MVHLAEAFLGVLGAGGAGVVALKIVRDRLGAAERLREVRRGQIAAWREALHRLEADPGFELRSLRENAQSSGLYPLLRPRTRAWVDGWGRGPFADRLRGEPSRVWFEIRHPDAVMEASTKQEVLDWAKRDLDRLERKWGLP